MQFKFNSSTNQITAKCCLLLLFLFLSLYQLACAQEEQRHDSLPFPVRERNAATDDQSLTAWSLIVSAALTAQIYSQPDEYWQVIIVPLKSIHQSHRRSRTIIIFFYYDFMNL